MNKLKTYFLSLLFLFFSFFLVRGLSQQIIEEGFTFEWFFIFVIVSIMATIVFAASLIIPYALIDYYSSKEVKSARFVPDRKFKYYFVALFGFSLAIGTFIGYEDVRPVEELEKIKLEKQEKQKIEEAEEFQRKLKEENAQRAARLNPPVNEVDHSSSSIGSLFESKSKGQEEMSSIKTKWDDAFSLARSTPRIALSGQISNLQEIKRELTSLSVSDCLSPAKKAIGEHMDDVIQANLLFLQQQDESVIKSLYDDAKIKYYLYDELKNKCL